MSFREGAPLVRLLSAQAAISCHFERQGFARVALPVLMEANTLLDYYGEDLHSRAFMIEENGLETRCLRPDFTVPLCAMMAGRPEKTRRVHYCGAVFRRQPPDSPRPAEQQQIGIEHFGGAQPAEDDASVLKILCDALREIGLARLTLRTGDPGLVLALLREQPMMEEWRAQLVRHFNHPARFLALLERYALPAEMRCARVGEEEWRAERDEPSPHIGLRTPEEIRQRLDARARAWRADPLPADFVARIRTLLDIRGMAREALPRIRALLQGQGKAAEQALVRFEARLEALARAGLAPETLPFAARFGREIAYYDGFVFEIHAPGHGCIAAGGRYDCLPRALGAGGVAARAVGGVIRLESALDCLAGQDCLSGDHCLAGAE